MKYGTIASLLVVALIMGAVSGTVLFPRTLTRTVTLTQTVTNSIFSGSPTIATNSVSVTSVGSETFVGWHTILACAGCDNTTAGATFDYPLSVNYSGGPWILHYWVQNYSGTQNSINGNLIGSGNSEIWITFNVAGYAQYTLCASATKAPNDSPQQFDLPLTLSLLNQNETAIGSNPTAEVCGSMAV